MTRAQAMGSTIDKIVSHISSLLRGEADPRRRTSIIKGMKDEMRDAYHDIVEGSEDFKAHQSWINSFRLRSMIVKVRPTVRELYLFKDRTVDKRLKRLVKKRDRLRKRACARVSPQMVKISLAYHEEFDVAWLREMESTLGYPDCYANAYASDRQSHVNIEKRASRQIDDMYQAGRVDPFAYFVGSFFLCTLDCEAASALGRECLEHLRDLRPSLDEIYTSMVAKNLERVRRQLEIMAKYRARTEMELRGLN